MDRPKRRRDRFKQMFGLGPTASAPNNTQPSPSPTPHTLSRAATPQYIAESPVPPVAASSGPGTTVPEPAVALSSSSVPSHIPLSDPPPTTHTLAPDLHQDSTTTPRTAKSNLEKSKSVAWSGLKTLLNVVESGSGAFGPLESVVGGLNQYIGIFERAAKGQKDYDDLRTKLDSLLEDLAQFLSNDTNIKMTRSMNNLALAIDQELKMIEEKSSRGVIQRHVEALEDVDGIVECYRRIQGHLERLTLNANLSIWSAVNALEAGLRDTRLHRLFPTMSAVYNSFESADVQRRECTPDTRVDEIAKLMAWASNRDAESVYWMNGMAGTGKTTIAYTVCAQLDGRAALGASFFCSRLLPECRDVKLIIPAIAYQLARFSDPFQHALSKVLTVDPDAHTRAMKAQFKSLLVDPLLEVKHTLPVDFVVVIDALDECENQTSVEQILSTLLADTSDHKLPIRFLLSSRPEPLIYSKVMGSLRDKLDARLVLHELDQRKVMSDIQIYLHEELKGAPFTASQFESLVRQCGVLFIYASTAARYIKDGLLVMEHEERLNVILGSAPGSDEGNSQEIDSLYASILQAAFYKPGLHESTRARMKAILDTVICAQEPMTTTGLAGLLNMKNGQQVDGYLRPLGSIVNVAEHGGLVTTLHASFPDFMLDQGRSTKFHCDLGLNHARLARACFSTIECNNVQFNVCGLQSSSLRDDNAAGLNESLDLTVPPQLLYACRYWVSHVSLGAPQGLGLLLFGFLSRQLLLWMEVLNVRKCIKFGPGIMQRAEAWSKANNCTEETIDLTRDAWRFVTMFASHAVSQSTPHIYISMLPFWPELAPISTCYKGRLQKVVTVQGSAIPRRQVRLLATWLLKETSICACFSPDNSLIALCAESSGYLIDGHTGSKVIGPLTHDESVRSVRFSPDGALVASCSNDMTIRVWSTSTGQAVVDPITGHTDYVTSVCFTPDGMAIVSGSEDRTIRVWDWRNRRTILSPLQGHTDYVRSVCVSPDGTHVASGSNDGTVRLWSIESGDMTLDPMKKHTDWVRSVCFSPDGTRIISGSDDRTICIWNAHNGKQLAEPSSGHTDYVMSVAVSPDGKQIVSGSRDSTIRLWNTDDTSEPAQLFEGHSGYVNSVAFSSDGTRILSCSDDKTVRVWDARSKSVVDTPLEAHARGVSSVCYSPDGSRILSASSDATVRVWDACTSRALLGPLEGHSGVINCARFSPEGSLIAAGSANNTIQLWDSETGQSAGEPLSGHSGPVNSVCFSPDGTLIASGSDDGAVKVWSTLTKTMTNATPTGHAARVLSVCFSPDGNQIVSGSGDKTTQVWDATTGQLTLGPLEGHADEVWSVCFSPDGTRIASASRDKTIRLWDSSTGNTVCDPLVGHTGDVNSVSFSPDGEFIASGSDDTTIRLWDAHIGAAIGVLLTGHTALIWSISFSPNGSQIVSGSDDATIRVFDVSDLAMLRSTASSTPSSDKDQAALTFACQPWMLQDDGWVVDAQSRLLAWVPPDLHIPLLRPRNTLLIAPSGSVTIELDYDKLGEGWAGCYKPRD